MTFDEQIETAWKEYKPVALSTNSMVLSHDVFAAGYRAMAKRLYRQVKPEEIEDGELYDVKVKDGGFQSAFALVRGAEISFWYHEMEVGEVREIFISPLEIEKVLSQVIPSPSEVFGEEVG